LLNIYNGLFNLFGYEILGGYPVDKLEQMEDKDLRKRYNDLVINRD